MNPVVKENNTIQEIVDFILLVPDMFQFGTKESLGERFVRPGCTFQLAQCGNAPRT